MSSGSGFGNRPSLQQTKTNNLEIALSICSFEPHYNELGLIFQTIKQTSYVVKRSF